MTGATTTWGAGVSTQAELAGSRGASSRRRTLAMALAMAVGAGLSGAVLGLVKQPNPNHAQEQSIYTATAAVETARQAQQRVVDAEEKLARAQARIDALKAMGAEQELADFQEAERLGVSRYMTSSSLWGDDRRRIEAAIVREARRNGLDPLLVAAVIQVESRFDPFAVSGVGACGLMQLMPPTAQWLHDKHDDSNAKMKAAHLFNPVVNIELGTAYLAQLMNRFDGDMNMALIAYNAGPGVAHSLTPNSKAFKRLAVYPKSVLAAYKSLLTPPDQIASR